ncbi:MAG: cupin domain-containing protein [Ectothiorhodospiraceae bacterium]
MTATINADPTRPALVDSETLEWKPSPAPGVERRMLERIGDERARVTSIVRYGPETEFPEHTHDGGEEFLVLYGTFIDAAGEYPAGTYVRNPVGSSHAPWTVDGCTIFVKLWWMHPDDQERVCLDTTRAELWESAEADGVDRLLLHRFGTEENELIRLNPGGTLPAHAVDGGEEIFVLAGQCRDGNDTLTEGTWRRQPSGEAATLESKGGCVLYCKRGHLHNLPPAPPQD